MTTTETTRPPRLTRVLSIVAWALVGAALIGLFVFQQDRIIRGNDRYDRLFDAYTQVTTDCALASDCDTDAPTPSEVVEAEPGPAGAIGPEGPAGVSVLSVSCTSDGRWLVTYSSGRVQDAGTCIGTPGINGTDGQNGQDGQTIVGPTGPAGADGVAGQPPSSWTYVDALGFTYTCTRTDPFDPAIPTYQCNPS